MALPDWVLSRLFLVIPEEGKDVRFTAALEAAGLIAPAQVEIFRTLRDFAGVKALKGRPLIERILIAAPELMSVQLISGLKAMRLVSPQQANGLTVLLRAAGRLVPSPVSEQTAASRLVAIFDDVFSPATVNYIRALDNAQIQAIADVFRASPEGFGERELIFGHRRGTLTSGDAALIREMLAKSVARAQVLRSIVSQGRQVRDLITGSRSLDSLWDVVGLAFNDGFNQKLLRNLVRAGVMSPERYALWSKIVDLGGNVWRKLAGGRDYESWAARGLLLSEGVLSPELIRLLGPGGLGIISQRQQTLLYPVANQIREVTRQLGSKWRTSRRYRVVPGEKPIKTFARGTQMTDKALLRLLAEASKEASKNAEALARSKRFGSLTRSRQQALVAGELHRSMRDLMEQAGHLIIFGEKEAALLAANAMEELSGIAGLDIRRSIRRTAQSGLDSYVSREESLLNLSRRVYGNWNVLNQRVDKVIAKALLRGLNAKELSGEVLRFIDPATPGGASYAAMRLARTEINNAFHQTQIRYTREMPWVEGYRWNLSGSHGRPDVCNDYAEHSEGAGRGVWRKDGVPGKPHPQCLCFITTETADTATWYKRYRSGAYNSYLDQITERGVFDEDTYTPIQSEDITNRVSKGQIIDALLAAATQVGLSLLVG